jgi:hypothetical protein
MVSTEGFEPSRLAAVRFSDLLRTNAERRALMGLTFPRLAAPLVSGLRALVSDNGVLVLGDLSVVLNAHVQATFGRPQFAGLDGYLCAGDLQDGEAAEGRVRQWLRVEKVPQVAFYAYDQRIDESLPFASRIHASMVTVTASDQKGKPDGRVRWVPHQRVDSMAELEEFLRCAFRAGYRSVAVRDPGAAYERGQGHDLEVTG